jgi:hypothetical protein
LDARADLQDKSILGEVFNMGKKFQQKFGELHGRPAIKQDEDSQAIHSSLSWVFVRMGPGFKQRLAAADCSGISRHLFVVLGGESAGFARLSDCRFIAIIIPVQSVSLFARTEIWVFEANNDELLRMATVGNMNESKRHAERSLGLRPANKQADIFCLCRPILYRLSVSQIEFCWIRMARLIQRGMVGPDREDLFLGTVLIIAALLVLCGLARRSLAIDR